MNDFFRDKVYVVTGGGRGIGRGIVEDLAGRGATQVIVLEQDAALNRGFAGNVTFIHGDVTRPDDCDRAVAVARSYGRLDGLCLVAGIEPSASRGPFWQVAPDVARRVIEVDVLGHYYMTSAAVPLMLEAIEGPGLQEEGSIVCMSSVQAVNPAPETLPHVIGKAGVLGFARGAMLELARRNIRVNTLLPGTILTEAVMESFDVQGGREANAAVHPRGVQGTVREVAAAVRFFLGPDSRNCYGAELSVDGGVGLPGAHGLVIKRK